MVKRKMKNEITIYLDEELALWLDGKALEGYKKASFIRAVLHREKEMEEDAREFEEGSAIQAEEDGGSGGEDIFGEENE